MVIVVEAVVVVMDMRVVETMVVVEEISSVTT